MSAPRFGRMQKATALVPLAVLSTAWTASLAGVGGVSTVAAASDPTEDLPDGTAVPNQAIEAPASVTSDGVVAPSVPRGQSGKVIRTASTNGIPSAALSAYQRADAVINAADKSCNLDWQLVAAIGRVESDHGRYGGNTLDEDGLATPGIYGVALNGKKGTKAIPDTDAGQYDNDTKWDRAVGPMQFIPSTWSVVGVDADNDGKRDPQDVDDAALAAAVYLCSGDDDLGTDQGRRDAVFRYNNSEEYVDLVLSIMEAYTSGDFSSVPNSTTSASMFSPDQQVSAGEPIKRTPPKPRNDAPRGNAGASPGYGSGGSSSGSSGSTGESGSTGGTTSPAPTPAPGGSTPDPGQQIKEGGEQVKKEVEDTTNEVTKTPKKLVDKTKEVLKDPVGEVEETLTYAQAEKICLDRGLRLSKLLSCINGLLD